MRLYHEQTTKEAVEVLRHLEVNQKFKSLNIALSSEDYLEVHAMVDFFINKVKIKYGKSKLKGKKIYKINLQAYPVSEEY
jgi:hypothetical protein